MWSCAQNFIAVRYFSRHVLSICTNKTLSWSILPCHSNFYSRRTRSSAAQNQDRLRHYLCVFLYIQVNGTYILKSGTDFRQFSTITLDFSEENLQVDIESVDVTSEYEPDNELSTLLEQYTGKQHKLLPLLEVQWTIHNKLSIASNKTNTLGSGTIYSHQDFRTIDYWITVFLKLF